MFPIVILAITDDDEREFMKQLYLDYHNIMRKEAYSILNRTEPLDDIIQDACIRLIQKIPLLRQFECCTLHTYIVYTVKSVTIDFLKKSDAAQKYTYFGVDDDLKEQISDNAADDADTVVDTVMLRDTVRLLKKTLHKLPDRDRHLLEFKYILSMSDKEISKIMGIKTASVRQYLTRARR